MRAFVGRGRARLAGPQAPASLVLAGRQAAIARHIPVVGQGLDVGTGDADFDRALRVAGRIPDPAVELAGGRIRQGHGRIAVDVRVVVPLELERIRIAAEVAAVAQHHLLVEDVAGRDDVDLALIGAVDHGLRRRRRRDQAADLDHLQADRERIQARIVVEGERQVTIAAREAGAQGRIHAHRLVGFEDRVVVLVLVADQHVVHRDGTIGPGIAGPHPGLRVDRRLRTDARDALRIARLAEQGFNGLIPAATHHGAAAGEGGLFAAVAAVDALERDPVALGEHVEQEVGLAGDGVVELAHHREAAIDRIVGNAVRDRHRQLDHAIGRTGDRHRAIGFELARDAARDRGQRHRARVQRVEQLRQRVGRFRIGLLVLDGVVDHFDRRLVVDVGQAALGLQQGFAAHQQGRLLRPGDLVAHLDRIGRRGGAAFGRRQAREPRHAAVDDNLVDVVAIQVAEEAGLGRIEVVHRTAAGGLGPELVLVVLEEGRRRLLAHGLALDEGFGATGQQAHRIGRRHGGAGHAGVAELAESRAGGGNAVDEELALLRRRIEVAQQHIRIRSGGSIAVESTAEVRAQGERGLEAGAQARRRHDRVLVVRVVTGALRIVLDVERDAGEIGRVESGLAEDFAALLACNDDARRIDRPERLVTHRTIGPEHTLALAAIPRHRQFTTLVERTAAAVAVDRDDRAGARGAVVGGLRPEAVVVGQFVDHEAGDAGFVVVGIDDLLADLGRYVVDEVRQAVVGQGAHDLDHGGVLGLVERGSVDVDQYAVTAAGGDEAAGRIGGAAGAGARIDRFEYLELTAGRLGGHRRADHVDLVAIAAFIVAAGPGWPHD